MHTVCPSRVFGPERSMLCCAVQVEPAKVIILEGILVLHMPELREECSMKIYVDTGVGVLKSGAEYSKAPAPSS